MSHARKVLSESQVDQINQALAQARTRTSATILPVIAASTGRYDRGEDMVGLWAAALGLMLVWALFAAAPVGREWAGAAGAGAGGLARILGAVLAGFLGGLLLANRVGWLGRLFVPRRQMIARAQARAERFFQECGAHFPGPDRDRAILIYVSLYERAVALVPSEALKGKLTEAEQNSIRRPLATALTFRKLGQGLCDSIAHLTEVLAAHCPPEPKPAWSSEMRLRILD